MALNIKNPETYRLARELADETGLSMTAAVTEAVRERLKALRAERGAGQIDLERAMALLQVIRERMPPGYLDQDFDEILNDEMGAPK